MHLTDFLGNEFGPGDKVLYAALSGRCANMIFAEVVEIYRVAYVDFEWTRIGDDDPVPRKLGYQDKDLGECDSAVRVKVQPLKGARWEQHHARSYWIDERSGRKIDPTRSKKYVAVPAHFEHADGTMFDWDGERAAYEERTSRRVGMYLTWDAHFSRTYRVNYGDVGTYRWAGDETVRAERTQLWYVSAKYHPWCKEVRADAPKPVTLTVTDNIVKWMGEVPGEVPVQVQ